MPKPKDLKETKRLWSAMRDLVSDEGGWVTSTPNHADITLEAPVGSDLPVTLQGLGYVLTSLGTSERLLPDVRTQCVMPVMVEVWAFQMPQLVAEKKPKGPRPLPA
jgi:hypothetical protein